jgi:hypothetical protein
MDDYRRTIAAYEITSARESENLKKAPKRIESPSRQAEMAELDF